MNILDKFRLNGKKALVTGGSRGLGKVAALGLAQAGADVAIIATQLQHAEAAAREIAQQTGVETLAIEADVSDPVAVEKMIDQIIGRWGTLDIAFNNAGIATCANAEDISLADWKRVMDVNATGVFLTTQAEAKVMLKQKKGSIINMASMSAHIANLPQHAAHYAASKAAVLQLSKAMAAEWADRNVRVNVISPGYHKTEMAAMFADIMKEWIPRIPMGRIAEAEELAGTVVFLASDASSYMTGSEIVSDGGYLLW